VPRARASRSVQRPGMVMLRSLEYLAQKTVYRWLHGTNNELRAIEQPSMASTVVCATTSPPPTSSWRLKWPTVDGPLGRA